MLFDTDFLIEFAKDLIPVVLSGIGAFFLSLLLIWIIKQVAKTIKWIEPTDMNRLSKPISILFVLIGLFVSSKLTFVPLNEAWTQAFNIFFILSFSWFLIRILAIGREFLIRQYDISVEDNLKARKVYTQIRVFERILMVLVIILGLAFSLMTFESIRNIGASILASAGIAGIIIGVAAQKLIANLLAGFQIAVTQPIRIEDVVIIENEWGWIEEITLTYVVVRIWDKRRLIVPATQFIEKPFQNWTRTSADILGTAFIHIDYKMPVQAIRDELTKILDDTPLWDGKVNVLQVTDLTPNTMELRVLVSAKDSPTAWDLRVHIREKMVDFLQREYPEYLPKSRIDIVGNTIGHQPKGDIISAKVGS